MVARIYMTMCMIAAILPLLPLPASRVSASVESFPGWPSQYQGRSLQTLTLSDKEKQFYATFPGMVARFSDGSREIIIRWVTMESRKLHSASDCFKGLGYTIKPKSLLQHDSGETWSQFIASNRQKQLLVQERISDSRGQQWTDVSSWYWAALLGKTRGPWWVVTVAESI